MITEHHTNVTHVIPKLIPESDNGTVIKQKKIEKKVFEKMYNILSIKTFFEEKKISQHFFCLKIV